MEIDNNIYAQYRDTPFKIENIKTAKQKELLLNEKIKNPNMEEYATNISEKTQEKDSSKNTWNSYNIILRVSNDKAKHNKEKELSTSNDNIYDSTNIETAEALSKNDTSLNFKKPNKFKDNIQQKQEELGNKSNDKMIVESDEINKLNEMDNKSKDEVKDNNKNEDDNKKDIKYYNPFTIKNIKENGDITKDNYESKCDENKNDNNKGKMPNIILTTFPLPKKNNEEKYGKFSRFLNLFTSKKKEKVNPNNEEIKKEEIQNNEFKPLEEKLKEENIVINDDKDKKYNEKDINKENVENTNINNNGDYNYVLSVVNPKNNEQKNDFILKGDKKEIINVTDNDKDQERYKDNSNSFIIKAEPIINNNKEEEMNKALNKDKELCESSEMNEEDKSSQYTSISELSFIKLIRNKAKWSPLLMAILLGSCGLFYLLYKKINLRELLSRCANLFKFKPGYLKSICSFIGACIEDFMEKYDDIYRLLAGIIGLIFFWFIFKFIMKKIIKRRKK